MIAFPSKVLLRCKAVAIIRGLMRIGPEFAPEIYVIGHMDKPVDDWQRDICTMEMWRQDGKWSYDGKASNRLDIVGIINPDGSMKPLTNELKLP